MDTVTQPQEALLKSLCLCFRIAGDTALNKNIHESVSAQIRKNFAKSKWRVSPEFAKFPGTLTTLVILAVSLEHAVFLKVTVT
jgi:hypothetical protein